TWPMYAHLPQPSVNFTVPVEPALIALDGGQRHVQKTGVLFRRARLLFVSLISRPNLASRPAKTPPIALFRFAEPALR
ncbi:hypothetical protein MZK49_32215, partial [Ensifer sesbaniae]|nr:hypothetical protein [Ensifer sesbaniae]